ncbi:MAG TPA: ankyrin repeat domain-containing protein, partial [Chthonomonadales bacterium]|nr:ankyrin repeat domain-containing protein [Chthonomonadales bacterium]
YTNSTLAEIAAADLSLDDAQLVTARLHGCENWPSFEQLISRLAEGKIAEPFRDAFRAIEADDVAALSAILDAHSDLANAIGTNGNSLLNLAGSMRRIEITRLLISHGADVNLANFKGWGPLHQAAYSNQAALIEILLKAGAQPNLEAYGPGGTPLMQALFWGHREAAEALAAKGVVPNNLRAASGAGRLDLVKSFFLENGELTPQAGARRDYHRPHSGFPPWKPANQRQEILDEALVYAAKNNQIAVMELLLSKGAGLDAEPYNGTALHWAIANGNTEAVSWLLDRGAYIEQRAGLGGVTDISPLCCAAWGGKTEMVKLLLQRGADSTRRDPVYHATPAGWADHNGHFETRDYLLEHGTIDLFDAIRFNHPGAALRAIQSDPAAVNRPLYPAGEGGDNAEPPLPIYRAIYSRSHEMVELLLQHGADPLPALPGSDGVSPARLAESLGLRQTAELLSQASAGRGG